MTLIRCKLIVTSIATLCAVAGPALAADLPVRAAPPVYVPPAPTFTWAGLYAGVNVGLAGDHFRYPASVDTGGGGAPLTGQASLTSSGAIGGVQAGFNYVPAGNLLGQSLFGAKPAIGVEADFDGAGVSGRAQLDASAPGTGSLDLQAGSRLKYLGTARGRIGLAFDRVLVFASGGFAYGRVTSSLSASATGTPGFFAGAGANHTGYAVGGGIEYAITDHLSLRTEYLRAELNTKQVAAASVLGLNATLSEKPSFNIVRAGLDYKFDFFTPSPVVARY